MRLGAHPLERESTLAAAFPDAFPVTPGHMLVVPRRHVASYFELSSEEQLELWRTVNEVKSALDRQRAPAGYNIGVNDGPAAGQTVEHAHVHVIPRYPGDAADPRGGVRWVMPTKADYWSPGE